MMTKNVATAGYEVITYSGSGPDDQDYNVNFE
jgi:hypothetical protein